MPLFCFENKIGSFRVTSSFLPLYTHPILGYAISDLPSKDEILAKFLQNKRFAEQNNLRLTLHPDQFVVLNSNREEVVQSSIKELLYHDILADCLGADVINIHLGGVYGDKKESIKRFKKEYLYLPLSLKEKLVIENDDKSYTPEDLLPVCESLGVPLLYDVHHHRCNPDSSSVEEASLRAYHTWNREPVVHISSPKDEYGQKGQMSHAEYIRSSDFPELWKSLVPLTVEVEAKAKELAVFDLMESAYQ